MTTTSPLPKQFAALEAFARSWGDLRTPRERYLMRQSSRMEDLREFHAAAAPRLNEIFDYLDGFPQSDLPEPQARLFRTVLGLSEVMQAVEVIGQPRVKYAPYPHDLDTVWVDLAERT